MSSTFTTSPRVKARIAGLLYLVCIATGGFAEMGVRARLVVFDDAVATAHNILASPMLYRLGLFCDLASFITGLAIAVIFYDLFKPVSRSLALLALVFAIVSNTVSLAAIVQLHAPLSLLEGDAWRGGFDEAQRRALSLFSLREYEQAFNINLLLFTVDCFANGLLIIRSTFLPRFLGGLLIAGGLGYLLNSFVNLMPPSFAPGLFPYDLLPSFVAEVALALWLVVFGVDAAKWEATRLARRS
jgi:hypothetical protein